MEPVIKHGLSTWDRAVLPPDEFETRGIAFDRVMQANDVVAAVGFEDASNPGLVGYLENYRTPTGLTTLICVPGVEATLLAGLGGARGHPSIKGMSFTQDVRWFAQTGEGIATVLAERGITSGRLGVVGLNDCLNQDRVNAICAVLEGFEIVDCTGPFDELRRTKRERELVVMRDARDILQEAKSACIRSLQSNGDVHSAVVIAERVARLRGCRDVRALVLALDGSLRPWPANGGTNWSNDPSTVYLAAEYLGYWAELGFTYPHETTAATWCDQALDAVTAALRVGSSGASLREALDARLGAVAEHVTLEAAGMGLAPVEAPLLSEDDTAVAREGDFISLRTWARDGRTLSVASTQVLITRQGSTSY
jgi:hypothetical protein